MRTARKLGIAGAIAALLLPALVARNASATSTLSRSDAPVVLTGAQIGNLQGIAPADLVAFSHDGSAWTQIPVQVDERHTMNIRNAYPANIGPCSGSCFTPGTRVVNSLVYSDAKTYAGADPNTTLDADDEVAFMVKDAGGIAPAGAPAGVLGNGVKIAVSDPLDGGSGTVYLFERDTGAQSVLDPSAGKDYVDYHWQVVHIGDEAQTAANYKTQYRFNGKNGSTETGNPENSWVQTAHYRRGMTERWRDNDMQIFRGGASGVDFLDRHDASLTYDAPGACLRDQNTFSLGEAAYITSTDGPVRAIRDYLGTNSGPLVQRRHIFYESFESIRIDLRVHLIPGPQEFFDYNVNATGLWYSNALNPAGSRIDGIPDAYATSPVMLPNSWNWETVDSPLVPLPLDPPAQGGVSYVVYYNTNNVEPTGRIIYRDLGAGAINYCNGQGSGSSSERAKIYGSHAAQGPAVMNSTDGTSTFLTTTRYIHYEAPGTADGPKRLAEDSTPLSTTATNL